MPTVRFEFLPISMGLQTFQSLDNLVLAGMNGLQCFCCTDVAIITAESLESHTERLRQLRQTLRDGNISALQGRMPYSPNICDASYTKKRTTGAEHCEQKLLFIIRLSV
jgi:hypothetical protein